MTSEEKAEGQKLLATYNRSARTHQSREEVSRRYAALSDWLWVHREALLGSIEDVPLALSDDEWGAAQNALRAKGEKP